MNKVLMLLTAITLSGCYTPKKATRQVTRAQAVFPAVVAKSCAAWYPVKELSTLETTQFIQGKDYIIKDSLFVDCTKAGNKGKARIAVPYTHQARVDTFRQEIKTTVENTARVAAQAATIKKQAATISELKGFNKTLKKMLYIAIPAAVLFLVLFVLKLIR